MTTIKVPVFDEWTVVLEGAYGRITVSKNGERHVAISAANPVSARGCDVPPEVAAEINRLSKEYRDSLPISGTVTGWFLSTQNDISTGGAVQCETRICAGGNEDVKFLNRACQSGRKFEITFREKP